MKILIAEDDNTSRKMLSAVLQKAGYQTIETCDGEEAFRVLNEANPPEIVILDWMMPKMTGIEICEKIREQNREISPYLLLLTAKSDINDSVLALNSGADDMISKPFDPSELQARIKVGLRMINLQKELLKKSQIAQKASLAKSEFLANMSHEIRTPMNGVLGLTSLLLDTTLTHQQSEIATLLKGSAESLLGILNDILDFSKIEAGKLNIEMIPFSLEHLVREAVSILEPKAEEKGLIIQNHFSHQIQKFQIGDPIRVKQIILNLVSNAIKFTSTGTVSIHVDLLNENKGFQTLHFEVIDTGIGISAEKQDLMFEKFTQADLSTTRHFGGTGLGLSICKQLVLLMGGQIGIKSEIGIGSTFWFDLTFKNSLQSVQESEQEFKIPTHWEHSHILLIEDNFINQKVASGLFKKYGIAIDLAHSGQMGIDLLKKKAYDIVFMDMQMPEMDGIETTINIRQFAEFKNTTIIAMTANAMESDRERCIEAGMNDYISKPIHRKKLENLLLKYLGHTP